MNSISSLPLPRHHHPTSDSESESDGEDSTLGLVLDRSTASSTVSMEPHDRVDALQRANAELGRKLMEAERTLQGKLNDHENELEEMQGRLEEVKSELSATKREEKELRAKEVSCLGVVLVLCPDDLYSVKTRRK
jgi:predicted RNase H-like nuclease (RuvC/YqgF family)